MRKLAALSVRDRKRARKAHVAKILQSLSEALATDSINLTVCARYVEGLLKRARVYRFLQKFHASELQELEALLWEIEKHRRLRRPCRTRSELM